MIFNNFLEIYYSIISNISFDISFDSFGSNNSVRDGILLNMTQITIFKIVIEIVALVLIHCAIGIYVWYGVVQMQKLYDTPKVDEKTSKDINQVDEKTSKDINQVNEKTSKDINQVDRLDRVSKQIELLKKIITLLQIKLLEKISTYDFTIMLMVVLSNLMLFNGMSDIIIWIG